jgi:hypothetical protein
VRITKTKLEKAGACQRELARFVRLFPNGATVNATNIRKAARGGLPMWWLVGRLGLIGGAAEHHHHQILNIIRPLDRVLSRGQDESRERERRRLRGTLIALAIIAVLDLR